jgi:hypothetical protein
MLKPGLMFITCGVLSAISFSAAASESKGGLLVKTNLEFTTKGRALQTESQFTFSQESKSWVTLGEPKKGIVLLAKIGQVDGEQVQVNYIVVDTTKKPNGVISNPTLTARLGKEAMISLTTDAEEVSITMTPRRVEMK